MKNNKREGISSIDPGRPVFALQGEEFGATDYDVPPDATLVIDPAQLMVTGDFAAVEVRGEVKIRQIALLGGGGVRLISRGGRTDFSGEDIGAGRLRLLGKLIASYQVFDVEDVRVDLT
ncbi:MAG: hypothetical protein ACOX5A_07980 [Aminivibrio sp.]|jgi:hypothetical protein